MNNKIFSFLIALLVAGSFQACAQNASKDSADIAVSEGVLKLAEWAKFDYMGQLSKAKTGDTEAIKALIGFHSIADGVDGLNHAVTCLELIPVAGDAVFASAAPVFKPGLKKLLLERLMLAQARTRKEELRKSMTDWAPITYAVLTDQPIPQDPEAEKKKREAMEAAGYKIDSNETKPASTGSGVIKN